MNHQHIPSAAERQALLSAKEFGSSEVRVRDEEIADLRARIAELEAAALAAIQSAAPQEPGDATSSLLDSIMALTPAKQEGPFSLLTSQGHAHGFNDCKLAAARLAAAFTRPTAQDAAEEAEADAYTIDRMGQMLARIAIAMKGPELPLHRHGYQDLPELVEKAMIELAIYRAARDAAAVRAMGEQSEN